MKYSSLFVCLILLLAWPLHAQRVAQKEAPKPGSAPATAPAPSTEPSPGATNTNSNPRPRPSPSPGERRFDQKSYAITGMLVTPEQAQNIVDQFKAAYTKLGTPRLLIHLNGPPPSGTGAAESSPVSSAAQTNAAPPLADRQTMRDVERLFGRPLRSAGATLTDQNVAQAVLGNKPLQVLEGKGAAAVKAREGLGQLADVVIEVLFSAKDITVAELSGDRSYSVPDIQATAIRVKDFAILGQATSNDILGRAQSLRRFDANEITEATALALMEDITGTLK